jgi:outer membrane protein
MKCFRHSVLALLALLYPALSLRAQEHPRLEEYLGIPARYSAATPLPSPQGFQDHVVDGKLVLSLDDAIRLAFSNNTDIHLNHAQLESAENGLHRSRSPFDPSLVSSFNAERVKSPSFTQLSGAPVLSTLAQNTQIGYAQIFLTGTNFQTSFFASKLSSNSTFNFFNPSISTSFAFNISQPLLRGRGLFPNRAPILIARRNLLQAHASFESEVSDILFLTVQQYWIVVQAREDLAVQKKSFESAQRTYDHEKKALSLGALPPLDIYRSESQVASRRIGVIQAEYALKQAEDQFRRVIGADIDPAIRALDLELPDTATPEAGAAAPDIAAALEHANAHRADLEASRQQLAAYEMNLRLAHNSLQPDLRFSGNYSGNGLGGNQFDTTTVPPQLLVPGGLGDSLNQLFHFNFPAYGFALTLNLPIKNHAAEANLGDALVSRRRDQYQQRLTQQSITLAVSNAVHQLEQSLLTVEAAKIALDLAQKNLQAEERKYELGAQTIFFVLDAQTGIAQAEQSLVQAQVGYQFALAALDHATGDLLSRHHVQIEDSKK